MEKPIRTYTMNGIPYHEYKSTVSKGTLKKLLQIAMNHSISMERRKKL